MTNIGKAKILTGISSSVGTPDTKFIAEINNVVTVFIIINLTSGISGNTTLITGLPYSYINYTPIRILNASTAGFLDGYIDNAGTLTVIGSASSGHSLRFCATYMTFS